MVEVNIKLEMKVEVRMEKTYIQQTGVEVPWVCADSTHPPTRSGREVFR